MVYIPGPGSGNSSKRDKKDKKRITIEKPKRREKEASDRREDVEQVVKPTIQKPSYNPKPSSHSTRKEEKTVKQDKPVKKMREKKERDKVSVRSNFLPYFLTLIAIVFAIMSFYKMIETEKAVTTRMDAMSAKYNSWYQEIRQKSESNSELLKPNGLIDKTLISSSLMNEYIVGVDDIINAAQEKDFSKVAFARIFISGSKPVYVSIEGNSKTLFAKNMNPGLSEERFYYYKQPQTLIEGKTIVVPRNFRVTTGNYEDTYILFFNFGDTKMAKMDAQKISNIVSKYNIWLPAK